MSPFDFECQEKVAVASFLDEDEGEDSAKEGSCLVAVLPAEIERSPFLQT